MEFAEVRESALVQRFIAKSLLHQALAVVKRTRDFQRGNIFAKRGELLLLSFTDAL